MKKEPIALATKLLVKAQGTKFDAEAAALTGRAYRLLADALNAYDDTAASAGAVRKRERRLLRDRRSSLEPQAPSVPRGTTEPTVVHVRRNTWSDLAPRTHVDLMI
jgi:hypothetical protein